MRTDNSISREDSELITLKYVNKGVRQPTN